MKVTQITVRAGRTFNHPHEQYSNLRPEIELVATLDAAEDVVAVAKQLQIQAEQLAEDQKQNMLKAIEAQYELGEARTRMVGLARQLKAAQTELDAVRQQWPEVGAVALEEGKDLFIA